MSAPTVWSALAARWNDLFPVRPARIEFCLRGVSPGGAVLDAGCGSGALLAALLDAGCDAWGFDLDDGFVAEASRRLGARSHRIARADLRDVGVVHPAAVFERIVCMGQTFPHLLDEASVHAFLDGARTRLVPGGRLSIQVVSDEHAPLERRLPTLEAFGVRLDRRRILVDAERAVLELRASTSDGVYSWSVEHRRWAPESLSAMASSRGWRSVSLQSDESGEPWTGREAGWILDLEPAGPSPD